MTCLVIIRHGNTFDIDDMPRRIGLRTDLPLVESGWGQARALGRHFKSEQLIPDVIYTSELKRAKQTAGGILEEMGFNTPLQALEIFNEIDHGPDENKTEEEVVARIGEEALQKWNDHSIPPDGWRIDPEVIRQNWHDFAHQIIDIHAGQTVMVVTSGGIARFAPVILQNYQSFLQRNCLKVKTGSYGIFRYKNNKWYEECWDMRPQR